MNDLILYTTEDGRTEIKLRAKDETVWLSQREIGQLLDVSTDNVGRHLKNIFEVGEPEPGGNYRGILGSCRRRQELPDHAVLFFLRLLPGQVRGGGLNPIGS
jgi:hypothetical protein